MTKFAPLRADAQTRAMAIQTTSARRATAQEACGLITGYVASEKQVVDYVAVKQAACGIPAEILTQLKANQTRSQEMMKGYARRRGIRISGKSTNRLSCYGFSTRRPRTSNAFAFCVPIP